MKKNNGLLLLTFLCLLWSLFSCYSCTNAKKLTVMDDLSPDESIQGLPKAAPVYHIKSKDNLYVSISTQDQDLTKMTDPTGNGLPLAAAFEGLSSRSGNGNLVDSGENISLPMRGKIPVAGMKITEAEDTPRAISRQYVKDATV